MAFSILAVKGIRARNRNAEDRLALHAGLSVKRGTSRYELWLLRERLDLLLKIRQIIRMRRGGRRSADCQA